MEIALEPDAPTCRAGWGILTGDTLKAAADAGSLMVGVTLMHRQRYSRQHLGASGSQSEEPQSRRLGKRLAALPLRLAIALNGSFFGAQRMLVQYMQDAYRTAE